VLRYYSPLEYSRSTDEAFYFPMPTVLAWRVAGIEGASLWGFVDTVHVDSALATLRLHRSARISSPARALTDLSGVVAVTASAFACLLREAPSLLAEVSSKIDRHVLVPPPGLAGATAVGTLHLLTPGHQWEIASDISAAVRALGAPDDATARIAMLVETIRSRDPILDKLRAHLVTHPTAGLLECARALRTSPRTLQRALTTTGTSFRETSEEARVSAACKLLAETDLKVAAVAREVGFASLSGFVRMFRARLRISPSAYRSRIR